MGRCGCLRSATTSADAADTLRSLAYLGLPRGLSNTVAQSVKAHPLRIMIVDNSGSMNTCDGNKMLNNNGSVKMVKCSRWVELSDEVMKVADVSSALNATITLLRTGHRWSTTRWLPIPMVLRPASVLKILKVPASSSAKLLAATANVSAPWEERSEIFSSQSLSVPWRPSGLLDFQPPTSTMMLNPVLL